MHLIEPGLKHELQLELDGFLGPVAGRFGYLSLYSDTWSLLDTWRLGCSLDHRAGFRRGGGCLAHQPDWLARAYLRRLCRAVPQRAVTGADLSLVFCHAGSSATGTGRPHQVGRPDLEHFLDGGHCIRAVYFGAYSRTNSCWYRIAAARAGDGRDGTGAFACAGIPLCVAAHNSTHHHAAIGFRSPEPDQELVCGLYDRAVGAYRRGSR